MLSADPLPRYHVSASYTDSYNTIREDTVLFLTEHFQAAEETKPTHSAFSNESRCTAGG